jgi:hypothetical protein
MNQRDSFGVPGPTLTSTTWKAGITLSPMAGLHAY